MPSSRHDVLIIGDFRFPGGTSSSIAEEIRAQAAAGYRTGLIQLKGPVLKYPHPIHPLVQACLDQGLAERLDPETPVDAALVLAHHPSLFQHAPRRPLAIDADQRLLVVDHPPFAGDGAPAYPLDSTAANAEQALGGGVLWAPVGPAVREQFELVERPPSLTESDWLNVLDPRPFRVERSGPQDSRPIVGRHSRPDPLKWPDDRATTLAIYPDDPAFVVRILGGGPFLRELVGAYPRNWQVWPFDALEPARFLATIDLFVNYHHSRWVEAFGRTVLEAMASGAVCVLPPTFRSLFGEGALYAQPDQVRDLVRRVHADRAAFRRQSAIGPALVEERFGPAAHVERLAARIGRPRPRAPGPVPRPPLRRVLLVTSNGVGIGHLTRMLALARRCGEGIQPVFLTFSRAFKLVREQGFLVEHLPFHRALGCQVTPWNRFLAQELAELIAFYEPAALVFDGNVPYQGLLDALERHPDVWSVWCRRGLWQPGQGRQVVDREHRFDLVIEPGDLAEAWDRGLTTQHRAKTRRIGPVRLLEADELLAREAARTALGLAGDRPLVLMQLGAGNNFDYAGLARAAARLLASRFGAGVVVADWPMAEARLELPVDARRIEVFPLARYLRAFDLVISAAGYNAFHEVLLAGVPAIFVPNEHPQQDDQLSRARFAESQGLGLAVRTDEVYRLPQAIEQLLAPDAGAGIERRCAALPHGSGASEAAALLLDMVRTRKVDRP